MWQDEVKAGSRTIRLESGRIARQAHGAVLLREGNTVILATVVYAPGAAERLDFFPLTVDYREYLSASGRIPGGFLRREARATDAETLSSRLCDRSLRPLFPKAFRAETQILATVLSYDPLSDPAVLAISGCSGALMLSEIPWQGPLAAVRVGRNGGQLAAFPTLIERQSAELDLVLSFSRDGVVMIEGGANQVPDAEMLEAIEFGREAVAPMLDALDKMAGQAGRPKITLAEAEQHDSLPAEIEKRAREPVRKALAIPEKLARRQALEQVKSELKAALAAEHPDEAAEAWVAAELDHLEQRELRAGIVEQGRRVDGRKPDQIRPIACEVDWLPSTHGSALFTRGETQAMVSLTLGTNQDRMLVESLDGVRYERFLLHYQMPGYSVGEVRGLRGPGRREVGHGYLARRALAPVIPGEDQFPYTIRIASEISESNGSSSMATVCGGTLALLDGGVPIAAPVAGIAMGLIREGEKIVILSDILGDEDHLGDMDFKVAGTANGITAIQMDNKIGSLPHEVMAGALEQARQGRLHILAEMAKAITAPRDQTKPHVPLQGVIHISPNRVRELIGPGGKVIQEIQSSSGTKLEVNDEGLVRIYAPNRAALEAARSAALEVAGTLEVGGMYEGVVTGVKDFGAFVRIRGQEGLVHISAWSSERIEAMSNVAKVGDMVRVKVLEPDRQGRLSLSRKAAL